MHYNCPFTHNYLRSHIPGHQDAVVNQMASACVDVVPINVRYGSFHSLAHLPFSIQLAINQRLMTLAANKLD